MRSKLRRKLRNQWYYERNQPSTSDQLTDFSSAIEFDQGMFNHQLGSGWYWLERDKRAFRWTEKRASCYLQSREEVRYVHLKGYSPLENRLFLDVDGVRVGEHPAAPNSGFELKYLLPFESTDDRIFEVTIESLQSFKPQNSEDKRDLSLMIFSVRVSR